MRISIIIFVILLFSACRQKEKVPAGIISREKMEAVMWDMIQADQFLVSYVLRDSGMNRTEESIKLYQQIFAIHNIDKGVFNNSLDYYRAHPDLMKDIMDSLARTRTVAPTLPVVLSDTVPPAGEERLIIPDTAPPIRKRAPAVPIKE